MEFLHIFAGCEEILNYEFHYYGFTFSLWNVFIFSVVAFALVWIFSNMTR